VKTALRDALDARGYNSLTPVQTAVLAPELEGRDLLVSAQTGSGKTVGFGLAIAPTVLEGETFDTADVPLALVIAPTRELALQVKRELSWLYEKAGVVLASCVGGMDMRDERRALARGAHIVAATPGRLRDHIMRGSIDLSNLRAVVLDEADEMLDLGFREDLEFILGEAPEERQTLLFSATVPKSIGELAKTYQQDAERVVVKAEGKQHSDIEYRAMMVADADLDKAVINSLRYYEAPNAIVFANTRAMVNRLTTRLSNRGFNVVALSGELSQQERTNALQAMRDGRAQVCVATDVAARGIDLPNLDLVIHAELPSNQETLLHRSGRTGRAGRSGVSALIVTKRTRTKANRLLGGAKLKAEWTDAPSAEAVLAKDETRMLADPIWEDGTTDGELPAVEKLLETFSAQKLATAYLRLLRATRSAPEELSDPNAKPAPREDFGPSTWFEVSGGRDQNIGPRNLVPMLCKNGGLNKQDIGAIRAKQDVTFIQIKATAASKLGEALGAAMELEKGVALTQMDEPPQQERREPRPGGGKFGKPRGDKFKGERRDRDRDGGYGDKKPYEKRKPRDEGSYDRKPRYDDRKPRDEDRKPRKPSPAKHMEGGADAPLKQRKPRASSDDAQSAPRRKPGAMDPSQKLKGPPPPKGKANSKKNKARAAAARLESKGKPAHRKGRP
jgi:ATP-dependent RNA helicase DeaD